MRKKKTLHKRFASDVVSLFISNIIPNSYRNSVSNSRNNDSLNSAGKNSNRSNDDGLTRTTITKSKHKSAETSNRPIVDNDEPSAISQAPISLSEEQVLSESKASAKVDAMFDQELDKPITVV